VKRILPIVMVGILGVGTATAQSSASVQSGTSAQSQGSVQTNKSGAQNLRQRIGIHVYIGFRKAGNSSVDISSGTKIDATLATSLDAKKNKPGDRVEARAAQDVKQDGKVLLKKGTRLVGHVTEAQARTKEQTQSQLGIVFDQAVMANGQEIPLNATIEALAATRSSADAAAGSDDVMASGSGMGSTSGAGARRRRALGRSDVNGWRNRWHRYEYGRRGVRERRRNSERGNTLHRSRGRTDINWKACFEQQRRVWPGGAFDQLGSLQRDAGFDDRISHEITYNLDSGTQMLLSVSGQAR